MRWLCCLLPLLGGCVSSPPSDGRSSSRVYFGIVRVAYPDRIGRLSAVEFKALGVGWESGPFLGWRSGSWIVADPAACQLVIVIRSATQAENAARVLASLGEKDACVADYTRSLSRPR